MRYQSTRRQSGEVSFKQAVFGGLADDGGLFHPTTTPDLSDLISSLDPDAPFQALAQDVAAALLAPELGAEAVGRIVDRAFPFSPVLTRVGENRYLLELWHGPSYAFKDFGASFLASSMEEFLSESGDEAVILVATSGDTGSAVARAFHRKERIRVVILYPSGRVSPLQEMQLTTIGDNVTALEVKGSFDDCQRMVKEAFMDRALSGRMRLTSANSINLGRLIPQAFYYIYAGTVLKGQPVTFCVPSGNFGNLTAGVYAWRWGLPAAGFIAATNINDVVPEYLHTGLFAPRPSVQTLSNAMDVGNPSNFERLLAIFDQDSEAMGALIRGATVTDTETLETIRTVRRETGLVVDPHTAVGWKAADDLRESLPAGSPVVILSTAHAAKFRETILEATGETVDLPDGLASAMQGTKSSLMIPSTLDGLRSALEELPQ